jgi:hypothetical protein
MRGLSDFPADEDLSAHSAEALVEEVKRAVAGPHTWFPQSQSGPTIYREVKLEYTVPGGDGSRSTRWLPGGRHILFEDSVRVGNIEMTWLRCWEIDAAQRREVWDITCAGTLQAAAFDFRTGSKLIVSLVLNDGYVVDETFCRDIHAVQARIQLHPPPGSQPVNRGLVQSLPTRSHHCVAVADADFR